MAKVKCKYNHLLLYVVIYSIKFYTNDLIMESKKMYNVVKKTIKKIWAK